MIAAGKGRSGSLAPMDEADDAGPTLHTVAVASVDHLIEPRYRSFRRAAAVPLVLFLIVTNFERWRVGRYFWNKLGLEYTMMWLVAMVYFLIHGGGPYSLDRKLGREL